MPGEFTSDPKQRYKNVLENPHIVDWYFSHRLNEFLKVVSFIIVPFLYVNDSSNVRFY